ncbi:MAG: PaaI family thioesterase [Desulfotomaculaceae bacterium]|nr:PaaI family thioesterase [Desulfotomaculaceae bacterium]
MVKLRREEDMCFACSPRNPIGLKLVFEHDGDVCRTHFVAKPEHQGWDGVLHGGLVATLLDEVMAQWLCERGYLTMTAEMTIRYSKAIPIGEVVIVEGYNLLLKKRLIEMAGKVLLPDGTVAVRATAKYLKVDQDQGKKS